MDKVIHLSIRLDCPPLRAFEMFTGNSFLQGWLAPLAEVEPVVDGKYELFWEPDDRENNSTIGCRITAMKSSKLLAFEWRSPKQFKHFANQADPLTHVVVTFLTADSGIDVHLVHSGWRSTPEWEEARQWQERAWRMAFAELPAAASADRT